MVVNHPSLPSNGHGQVADKGGCKFPVVATADPLSTWLPNKRVDEERHDRRSPAWRARGVAVMGGIGQG